MASFKYGLCICLLALGSIQFCDAWLWSWSVGSRSTVTGRISGIPGVTRSWSAEVIWSINFARNQDKLRQCLQVADATIKRHEWQAVQPRRQLNINGRAREVFLWHTGSNTCNLIEQKDGDCQTCLRTPSCVRQIVKAIQDTDLKQGTDDIRYNFLIDQDGVIYEGRGWGIVGQHTAGKNAISIGVALIGDFSQTEPSQAAQDALSSLISCGKVTHELTPDAPLTTSPDMAGQAFYDMLDRCDGLCVTK